MNPQSLIGTTIGGTYAVERIIGEGGMGSVLEARHLRLPTKVAIKMLLLEGGANPEVLARFRREAEITSTLRHPNIVQVTDFNVLDDGTPYLVMELLEGEDLSTRLQRVGKMPFAEVLPLVRAVAAGLSAAHKRDIVHRDLKPQNIFLAKQTDGTEIPKIVDFGISKITSGTQMKTRENMLLGTPNYMSPEQAKGKNSEVDARTDQWALAAIAYQCLTGKVAFAGDSLAEVMYQVVAADPPPVSQLVPEVPAPTTAALQRAMAKSREERFPSVIDFAQSLDAAGHAQQSLVPVAQQSIAPAGGGAIRPVAAAQAAAITPGISAGAESNAVMALVLNLVLPGVGSLVGGRTGAGVGQLVLFLVGLPLSFFVIGLPIVAAAWIWSVITGIQLLGGKK